MSKRSQAPVMVVSIDAKGAAVTPAVSPGGLAGSISWERLGEALKAGKEVRAEETVLAYVISEHGIKFFVSTTAQA